VCATVVGETIVKITIIKRDILGVVNETIEIEIPPPIVRILEGIDTVVRAVETIIAEHKAAEGKR
jgi:hypothetical protein